jgi:hypothetical protein
MLEDASIKLLSAAWSVTTVSPRVMLRAMIEGERDAWVLAEMAKRNMRSKTPDLAQALEVQCGRPPGPDGRPVILDRLEQWSGLG